MENRSLEIRFSILHFPFSIVQNFLEKTVA